MRDPEVDERLRLLGARKVVHLDEGAPGTLQVGSGDVHVRAGKTVGVDLALQVEVGIGFDRTCGAHRRNARSEVQPRRGEGHLRHQQRWLRVALGIRIGPCNVVQVVVHPDETGQHAASGQVQFLCAPSRQVLARRGDRSDPAVGEKNVLIVHRGRARAVDDTHMAQYHWVAYFEVVCNCGRRLLRVSRERCAEHKSQQ